MKIEANYRKNLLILLLITVFFTIEQLFENYISESHTIHARVETLQDLNIVKANLNSILTNNLALINGLRIAISANPSLSQSDFDKYAREIMRDEVIFLNFAAAPNMIVKYVYPDAGNESVMGLNYLTHPKQSKEAIKVRDTRSIVVAGPVDLVQGGKGIIGRVSVYHFDQDKNAEVFWGIISAPMLIDKVMEKAGVTTLNNHHPIAIRKTSTSSKHFTPIFGDQNIFAKNHVSTDLSIANEAWHIATFSVSTNEGSASPLTFIRIAFCLMTLLVVIIILIRARQSVERQGLIETLKYREGMLEEVGIITKVGGWVYKQDRGLIFWSKEVLNIFEIDESVISSDITEDEVFHKIGNEYQNLLQKKVRQAVSHQKDFELEFSFVSSDNNIKWVMIKATATIDSKNIPSIQGFVQDITERKNSEELILQQANYDPLTSLPNRRLFDQRLQHSVRSSKRTGDGFAVLYIDLDRFKSINDSLGHDIGDQLLIESAHRFKQCIRESDTLSRRSGDEFTLIADQLNDRKSAEQIARHILQQLKESFHISGNQIYVSASIGIAVFPDDGSISNTLLKKADQAMYKAKDNGRNTFCYFTDAMQVDSDRRLQLHMYLTEALQQDQLQVYYQPIIDIRTGSIAECEALARWFHPTLGEIPPQDFIGLAEDVGLIQQIGTFVTQQAMADINHLNSKLSLDIGLSLNKSYREFVAADTNAETWFTQIINTKNRPRLIIEITESLLMEDDTIYSILDQLRHAGIKIAIDDFGTGYSSLSYLRRFPVDILKIDRSFVRDINIDNEDLVLVEAILAMANNLGLEVIAEGVENKEQNQLLFDRHCQYAQGFYYGRPMPIKQLSQWLNKDSLSHQK